MKNYIHAGAALAFVAGATIVSGQGVLAGSFFGIATGDVANGASGTIQVEGVFSIAKATGVTFAANDRVYWDDTAKKVTTVSSGNRLIGVATAAAGSAVTTLDVKLTPDARPVLTAEAALDFPSIAAAASSALTISVPGAAVGDIATVGLPAVPTAGLLFTAWVSAADTVTVRATNITAGAIDAASATYKVAVSKF
jgi:predicted RecA/RadA family phage recombinase